MVPRSAKLRESIELAPKDGPIATIEQPHSQRRRQEAGRYLLQVDRQTKGSYDALETAETAGLAIKTGHPIVQVSIYDTIDCVNKLVELPA